MMTIINALIKIVTSNNDRFQFVCYILELLVSNGHNQKSAPNTEYRSEQMITEEDRKNLEWLKKLLTHTKGEDDGQ